MELPWPLLSSLNKKSVFLPLLRPTKTKIILSKAKVKTSIRLHLLLMILPRLPHLAAQKYFCGDFNARRHHFCVCVLENKILSFSWHIFVTDPREAIADICRKN